MSEAEFGSVGRGTSPQKGEGATQRSQGPRQPQMPCGETWPGETRINMSGRRTAVLLRAEVIGHPYPKGPNKSGSHLPPYKKTARLEPQCRTSDRWKPQEQVPKFCQLSLQPQVPPVPVGRMAKGEFRETCPKLSTLRQPSARDLANV
ncbi:uncharacterized protein CCOS01_14165 [Colletotrichum costaricense]|uniref:Uncharacterized protein n=1 Tax=Colletotrichum costaricense TaxID=1209916 RepID=A0AAI9YK81_9PEZI|nr:uncharacterized protein CCOS01_14165 [Colletotrichum costaricense]KAK1514225.1 hypothetical protein CCOS01_14165 [Colletotrichum costaricense]